MTQLNESGLSRVTSHMKNCATGMITAYRSEFSRRENMQRNRSLQAKLLQAGFLLTAVKGDYTENRGTQDAVASKEESFFVVNPKPGDDGGKLQKVLVTMGAEFGQESIFSKPFGQSGQVVGTSNREGAWPGEGEEMKFPTYKPGHEADAMTRVNGRPFAFGESTQFGDEIAKPKSVFSLWVLSEAAKKPWQELELSKPQLKILSEEGEKIRLVDTNE